MARPSPKPRTRAIDWSVVPVWTFFRVRPGLYCIKINHTVEKALVSQTIHDGHIKIDIHVTGTGRLVGYAVYYDRSRLGETLPRVVTAKTCCYFFYRPKKYRVPLRGSVLIVYKDVNVRVFKYRKSKYTDFMVVLRLNQPRSTDEC